MLTNTYVAGPQRMACMDSLPRPRILTNPIYTAYAYAPHLSDCKTVPYTPHPRAQWKFPTLEPNMRPVIPGAFLSVYPPHSTCLSLTLSQHNTIFVITLQKPFFYPKIHLIPIIERPDKSADGMSPALLSASAVIETRTMFVDPVPFPQNPVDA